MSSLDYVKDFDQGTFEAPPSYSLCFNGNGMEESLMVVISQRLSTDHLLAYLSYQFKVPKERIQLRVAGREVTKDNLQSLSSNIVGIK